MRNLAWAAVLLALSCTDDRRDPGTPPSCVGDEEACKAKVGGGKPAGGGGEGGTGQGVGGAASIDGSVVEITEPSFGGEIAFVGQASVVVYDAATLTQQAAASVASDGSFVLDDVPAGEVWGLVVDEGNSTPLASTFSPQVSPLAGAVFPILQRDVVEVIGAALAPPVTVDFDRTHVFVTVVRNGAPLPGVSLVETSLGGVVGYSLGAEVFTTDATATDAFGRIAILNFPADPVPALRTLTLEDADGVEVSIAVPTAIGAVTIAGFSI